MAARAYWKGYLKLSLVTCPVALYPASSKADKTRFHQINKKTGHRLRQQMVDEETGRVVDKDNKGRGYELTKGKFVEIEPEEIDAIEFENTHTIDIDKFVPEEEIDKRYYERPYYIVPDGKSGEEAFARHPRRHEGQGPRGAGRHHLRQPPAHPRHRAVGQGHARHHAALRLRGARREGVLQGHRQPPRAEGDGQPCLAHPRHQGRPLRSRQVQGRVRAGAAQARQAQGRRQDHRAARRKRGSLQRHRSHGSPAPERQGQGQEGSRAADEHRAARRRSKPTRPTRRKRKAA